METENLSLLRPVNIKASRCLLIAVAVVHLAAILSILLSGVALGVKLITGILLLGNVFHYCYRWRTTPAFRLQKLQDGFQFLKSGDGSQPILVKRCYYWSNWLLVFEVRSEKKTKAFFPVLFDSCDPKSFHYLKIISKSMSFL
jgi:hypothetical protein